MQHTSIPVADGEATPHQNLEHKLAQLVTKSEHTQLALRADLGILLARLELWEQRLLLNEQRLVTEIARYTEAVRTTKLRGRAG